MGEAVDELIARMVALLALLEADGDPSRFFLATYLRITRAVRAAVADGLFEDPPWVARWDVDFASFYLDALEAYRRDPATVPAPWQQAFGAKPTLQPQAHVLLGVNAHINFDLPQSLVRVIPTEDAELQRVGDRRTPLDRLLTPINHAASRRFLREARHKVWINTNVLQRARVAGDGEYRKRLAELETLSAERVADLLRPGPVLLRLAVHGFGVTLAPA